MNIFLSISASELFGWVNIGVPMLLIWSILLVLYILNRIKK